MDKFEIEEAKGVYYLVIPFVFLFHEWNIFDDEVAIFKRFQAFGYSFAIGCAYSFQQFFSRISFVASG